MNYLALSLIIVAVFILAYSIWQFRTKRDSQPEQKQNTVSKSTISKPKAKTNAVWNFLHWLLQSESERRRDYYRNVYLKSDAWKRKRYVVLKRDNWRCRYCGGHATQVHHLKYARRNIGKEPIEWLVSVCGPCHDAQHN